ncbi:hypothetical protein BGX34_005849, partial [Mortierella sp. NVP85]
SSKKRSSKGKATHRSILPPQQETSSSSTTTLSKAPAKATTLTRFVIPEILSRIINFLEPKDIFSTCQVSCLFHNVCAPELWKIIRLDGGEAAAIWHGHEDFRMGLVRYGLFVKELRLMRTYIGTEDMKLIAENCTRLRVLDLTETRVQAEALKVLLHSDPYDTLPGSAEKREKQTRMGGKGGEKGVGRDGKDIDVEVNMEGKMWEYRKIAAAANHGNSRPYSSAAGSASTSLVKPSSASYSRLTRSAKAREKLKAARRQFPYFLEELILNKCPDLLGTTCLPIISRLGPQLTHLALDCVKDVTDEDMLHVWKHCTNLRRLSLKETGITDILLAAMTESMNAPSGSSALTTESTMTSSTFASNTLLLHQPLTRLPLTHLNVVGTDVSDEGLVSVIHRPTTEIQVGLPKLYLEMSELELEEQTDFGPSKRTFTPNTVLTSINFTGLSEVCDRGFEDLFQYATELSTICLEGCGLGDEPLLILAENYRKRMEIQGLGVSQAWHNHDIGNKRFERSQKKGRRKGNPLVTPPPRFYAGGKVVGGLKVLWLKDCPEIGNKGIRAIVRSCIGLERLGLIGESYVSLRVFRGPWACLNLVELDISGMNVRFKEPIGLMDEEIFEEECCEIVRFPISPVKNFNKRLDFDRYGTYDFISRPSYDFEDDNVWEEDFGEEDLEEEESGEEDFIEDDECLFDSENDDNLYDIDFGDEVGRRVRPKFPPLGLRNQTAHRTTLQ